MRGTCGEVINSLPLLVLVVVSPAFDDGSDLDRSPAAIVFGEPVTGVIGDDDGPIETETLASYTTAPTVGRVYRLDVDEAGPVTVELRSYGFDAYLVLRDEDGTLVAEDDDGLIGTHARIVAELAGGTSYRVDACALHGQRGEFELVVTRGRPPADSPTARARLELDDAERRVRAVEAADGAESLELAAALDQLALVLRRQGATARSRPVWERALAIRETALGPHHPDVAHSLSNLAVCHAELGDFVAARTLLERGLTVYETALGPRHHYVGQALNNLAGLISDLGDPGAARPLYERALAIREETFGAESPAVAETLSHLAGALRELGEHAAARPLLERALAITEAAHGPGHPEVATRLGSLSRLLLEIGDTGTARPLLERSLAIREATLGPHHPDIATSLNSLASLLREVGDYAASRPLYERALVIREAAFGPDHPLVAYNLTNLGLLVRETGDHVAARPMLERALRIHETAFGPDHPNVANSLNNLGALLLQTGDYAAARRHLERAIAIDEARYGPDHPSVASGARTLGDLHRELGDLPAARTLHERALRIREDVYGPDHPLVARSLGSVAALCSDEGDFAAARTLHERALAIYEAHYDPDHPDVAGGIISVALVLQSLGDLAGARPLLERALAIREAAFGPDHLEVAESLGTLATLLGSLGDLETARSLHARNLAIHEAAYGPDHPDVATCLARLASVLTQLGDSSAARPLLERALSIFEAAYGPEHLRIGATLDYLAVVHEQQGDLATAQSLTERALSIGEAVHGREHRSVARSLGNLAILALSAGEPERALSYGRRLDAFHGRVRRTLASLTEGEGHLYLARQRRYRDIVLSAATAVGDVDAAYATVLDAKGKIARLTLQTGAQIRESVDSETLALSESLRRVQARLSGLALATDGRDRHAHTARLEALREERDRLERELRQRTDDRAEVSITPADVGAALPPGAAIVDLLTHWVWQPPRSVDGETSAPGHWGAQRLSAWILRADDRGPRHVDLGPVAPIEAAIAAHVRRVVADGDLRGVALADRDSTARASMTESDEATLRVLLWDPLRPHLRGVSTVLVSPDGALGTLPFETIRDERGRFLVEDHSFVYLSDGGALVGLGSRPAPLGDTLLAAGGVDYDRRAALATAGDATSPTRSSAPSSRSRGEASRAFRDGWSPLPATVEETRAVVAAHRQTRSGGGRTLLLGADATEERLKVDMPRHALLHLATHGFFQPEGLTSLSQQALDATGSERSGRQPALPGGDTTTSETVARLTGLHPGLLSGLVLAGANQPPRDEVVAGTVARSEAVAEAETDPEAGAGPEAEADTGAEAETETGPEADTDPGPDPAAPLRDDGYLTASEVTLLDLSNVDLVVLSACETGLGRPQSGEGLLGLRRAFHMAGADTVISSLWSVKDESTSELMQSFYANLFFEGMGRHEALRAAQLEMLQRNRMEHRDALPSTWGAFVLSGEWR